MKNLFLTCFLFGLFLTAQAQDYRFYNGVQAGPKLSFSNSVLHGYSDYRNETNTLIRHQEGLVFGYVFPRQKFILETGFGFETYGVELKFPSHPDFGAPPIFWYNYVGEQTHLKAKFIVNNPNSKITFRTIGGLAYFRKYSGYFDNNIFRTSLVNDLKFTYNNDMPENFGIDFSGNFRFTGDKFRFLIFQAGTEIQVNISNHFSLLSSLVYQTSIEPVSTKTFKYSYNVQGDVIYEPYQYGGVISKAEAISLNMGLVYSFSNRNKSSE